MIKKVNGIVHGKTIEFTEELGVADGEQVEVTISQKTVNSKWGEGIMRSAGVMAGDSEFEDVFRQIELERRSAKHRESGE